MNLLIVKVIIVNLPFYVEYFSIYIYNLLIIEEVRMREAIVYLTIACLSMSNSCFGMQDNTRTSSGLLQNEKALSAVQEYNSFEKGVVRSKKDLRVAKRQSAKQNFVKYIFCTTALASISAFAYFFIPGASNFVNSKVKYFVNFVNNKFKSEGVNIIDQVKISAFHYALDGINIQRP